MRNRFPYDDRNEADYQQVTLNISLALELIDKSPEIPATQNELARLAKCSRGTLRLRKWPLDRLKEIKARRKAEQSSGAEVKKSKSEIELHIEDKKHLLEQLQKSRSQNAILAFEKREIVIENKKLRRAHDVAQAAKTSLEERCRKYESELAELRGDRESGDDGGAVVPFRVIEGASGENDE